MTSVVSICNLALSNLAAQNIQSLSDPETGAKASAQFYEHVRDTLLQAYPWRFASKTVALAQVENTKTTQWGYAYRRPVDCLKPRCVLPAAMANDDGLIRLGTPDMFQKYGHPFDAENATIYCGLSPALLHYTVRVEDPVKFPPLFIEALSWQLSVRMAMPVTKDPAMRKDAYQMAQVATAMAQAADANEVRETSDHASELVVDREAWGHGRGV